MSFTSTFYTITILSLHRIDTLEHKKTNPVIGSDTGFVFYSSSICSKGNSCIE